MITQLIPLIVVAAIGYFAFTRMKAMKGAASSSAEAERARLAAEFATVRQPGESDAAFVGVGTFNKLGKNRQFFVALTNKQLLLSEIGAPKLRAFSRRDVRVSATSARWTNIGNTAMTTTHGWDVSMKLPQGEALEGLRLYPESPYDPMHAPAVEAFLREANNAQRTNS